MGFFTLSPSKQRPNKKTIYGFDIETYDNNKKFLLGSVWSHNYKKVYFTKQQFIKELLSGKFNDSIIVATNLGFDFFGTMFDDAQGFNFIMRGSALIFAKTYVYNGKFNRKSNHHKTSITFLDTLNYALMSVKQLGDVIQCPKLEHPECLGKEPQTDEELKIMIRYNLRDSEISCKALTFFYNEFEKLGASPRLTLSSTAMSLFRNKYLKNEYHRHDIDVLREQFNGYYGGRTEAFARGTFENYNYYDFCSLYPSVMLGEFPDPNTLRINKKNTDEYIQNYEGMSKVDIYCPYMDYPLLPVRHNNKLLFPTGNFTGYYTHVELRQAVKLGYVLKKVHKCFYYTGKCKPFAEYIKDMYAIRRGYKDKKSPVEKVVKILMNGLYGKFGQKFDGKDNVIPFDHTVEELDKFYFWEFVDKKKRYIRIKENRIPSPFCIPIWASYVTALGRLKLHETFKYSQPIYCDTDSIITKKFYVSSTKLGAYELEHDIKTGIIVKPKFYALIDNTDKETVKIKGIGTKLVFKEFHKLLIDPTISYKKFVKIRESLRRGFIPNEIIEITKHLNLNDDKRKWVGDFKKDELQFSKPNNMDDLYTQEKDLKQCTDIKVIKAII